MNERSIFLEALSKETPAQRSAYLGQACGGDAALRQRVEALLTSHEQAGSFLNKPVPERLAESATPEGAAETQGESTAAHDGAGPSTDKASGPRPLAEGPGSVIGPYQLLEPIGEGGMGTVYLAEQTHPVQRQVALKIIKAGMDSAQVITRFEAERQALALMDHPNIAKVLDAGATETGRPYFVMELVQGQPITRYCNEHRLTLRQRLELFAPVCQAIQHAHQKGIIHRDVKPSNVLVALYDGKPVVKVIDFGIAKATGQRLTEKTLYTEFGAVVGTLEYMSPEQAALDNQDIDTRSDIYSLGVLLYELLTGTTPLNRARLKKAAFTEMLRLIREEEPPRPSTRLSESKDTLAAIAAQRQTEPAKLAKLVRGELDWLVMKALEKDRSRRYDTAASFALDLQRHLADEPVQACPPSAWYRFRKFARRHKAGLTAAVLVAAALLGGAGFSVWQAVRATHAEQRTSEQLIEKEKHFRSALDAVDQFLFEVGRKDLASVPGLEQVRRRVLERGLKFFQGFLRERSEDPAVRFEAGMAYRRVGNIRELLGRHAGAEDACGKAIALLQALADGSGLAAHRRELGQAYHDRAGLLLQLGRRDEAAADHRRARDLHQKLLDEDRDSPTAREDLACTFRTWGLLLSTGGDLPGAEKAYRRAVALREPLADQFPDNLHYQAALAASLGGLASVLDALGQSVETEKLYRRVLTVVERARRADADDPTLRLAAFRGHLNLAGKLTARGRSTEAEAIHRAAVDLGEGLVKDFPSILQYRENLAGTYSNWGALLWQRKRLDEAARRLQRARELRAGLLADFPKVPNYRGNLGSILHNLAAVRLDQGKLEDARQLLEEAIQHQLAARKIDPKNRIRRVDLSNHYTLLAVTLERLEVPAAELDKASEAAVVFARKLADDFPKVPDYQHAAWNALHNCGQRLENRGLLEGARLQYKAAFAYLKAALVLDPRNPRYFSDLSQTCSGLFVALKGLKRGEEKDALERELIPFLQQLLALGEPAPQAQSLLGGTLHNVALRHLDHKEVGPALELLEQAVAHQQAALKAMPDYPQALEFLGNHYVTLANIHGRRGERATADRLKRQAVAVLEKLVPHRGDDLAFRSSLAIDQTEVAFALLRDGKELEEARRLAEQTIGHQLAALKGKGDEALRRQFLGRHHKNLGDALVKLGKRTEAEKAYRDCLDVREKLSNDFPANAQYRFDLGVAYVAVADQLDGAARAAEKEKLYAQAVSLYREQVARYPNNQHSRSRLGSSLHKLAVLRAPAGKLAEARDLLQEAITHQQVARNAAPENTAIREKLFDHHLELGGVFLQLKEPARAEQTVAELRQLEPETWRADYRAGGLLERLVQFHDAGGAKDKAAAWRKKLDDANLAHQLWKDLLTGHQARHRFLETTQKGSLTAAEGKRLHEVPMKAGRTYVLDMESKTFDTLLILEDADGARVALNDDISAANLNSRIIYTAEATATHRIVATTYTPGETGFYVLRIRELVPKK